MFFFSRRSQGDPESVEFAWRVVGKSVRGASHARKGLPNQDAIDWSPSCGWGPPLVVSLSDGHGSARNFRSNIGSNYATAAAKYALSMFATNDSGVAGSSDRLNHATEELPAAILAAWEEGVRWHAERTPFTEQELAKLRESFDEAAVQRVMENAVTAYGATLLAVLVTRSYIIYLQLGDGEILSVTEGGKVSRVFTKDESLIADETTSLCGCNASKDFRIRVDPVTDNSSVLVVVATDGYANSFATDAGFLQVGSDLLKFIRTSGVKELDANLEHLLKEATQSGSGDDITVAIILREG